MPAKLGEIAVDITITQKFAQQLATAEKQAKAAGDKIENALNKSTNKGFAAFGKQATKMGEQVSKLGGEFTKVSVPIVLALGLATAAAVKFEDQVANVAKTVGLQGESLNKFRKELLDLSTQTRTSIEDLTNIATVGGQIGIAEKDIIAFTSAIDKLNVALGDEFSGGAEQISNEIGKLRNNFKDIQTDKIDQDLLHIANAINELGATGLATGEVMTDFAGRISGLISPLGASAGDILGLSATLQELGVTAERGGSAIGRIFTKMTTETEKFAKAAGMSTKEFKDLVNKDINQAFIVLVENIAKNNKTATEFGATLDALGLKGVGNQEVFLKLAGNLDLLRKRQDLANKAIKETDSIMEEFNKKNSTTQAELGKLRNRITRLGIEIGSALLPVLNKIVDGFGKFANVLSEGFGNLPPGIQQLIVGLGLLIAAIGPLLLLVGSLISSVGTIATAFSTLAPVLAAVTGPIGLIVVAIGALIAAFVLLGQRVGFFSGLAKELDGFLAIVKNTINNVIAAFKSPEVQAAIGRLKESFNNLIQSLKPIFDSLIQLVATIFSPLADAAGADKAFFSIENAIGVLVGAFDGLARAVGVVTKVLQPLVALISGIIDIITRAVESVQDFTRALITAFESSEVQAQVGEIKKIFEEVGKIIEQTKETIRNLFPSDSNSVGKEFTDQTTKAGETIDKFARAVEILKSVLTVVVNVMKFFANVIKTVVTIGSALVTTTANIIKFFTELPGIITNGFNAVTTFIGGVITSIVNFFTVTLPEGIKSGIQAIVTLWQELPQRAAELGFAIGVFIGNIIKFFIELPGKIQAGIEAFGLLLATKFEEVRLKVITTVTNLITSIVNFFTTLPARISVLLTTFSSTVSTKFTEMRNTAVSKFTEFINKVVSTAQGLPGKISTALASLPGKVQETFNKLLSKASQFGKDFVNSIVNGIKSVGSNIGNTVNSFFSNITKGFSSVFKQYGGLIKAYAKGGLIYAQQGRMLEGRGTDSVLAGLTPGEIVLPRSISSQLLSLMGRIRGLQDVAGAANGVNVNVGTINAANADEGRRRGGDLGFGIYNNLRGKGLV